MNKVSLYVFIGYFLFHVGLTVIMVENGSVFRMITVFNMALLMATSFLLGYMTKESVMKK